MNELLLVATLTILFGALPLIFVGYQIAFNNKNHWINGVDQSKLSNPNGFVKYIGNSIITTGILVIVVCALLYFQAINYRIRMIIYIALIACLFFILERLVNHKPFVKSKNWYRRAILLNLITLLVFYLGAISWDPYIRNLQIRSPLIETSAPFQGLVCYLVFNFVFYWWHRIKQQPIAVAYFSPSTSQPAKNRSTSD